MEKETPRSVDAEHGVEAEGNSHELCVDYTGTSTPYQAEEFVPLTVTAIKYPNPVGKAYGLEEGKIEKRGQLKRTSPAVGETVNFHTFADFVTWRKDLGSEYMLTSGTFEDVGEASVVFKDTEVAVQVTATKKFLAHRARPGVLIIDIDFKDAAEVAGLYLQSGQAYTTLEEALEALSRVLPEADECAVMAGW
ncbi:MAG: hypothetical protein HOJ20_16215, partial [Rhodospirillaceae bacterium]|nr:hypothetical protein [Rhodospirillaceae bacterium]